MHVCVLTSTHGGLNLNVVELDSTEGGNKHSIEVFFLAPILRGRIDQDLPRPLVFALEELWDQPSVAWIRCKTIAQEVEENVSGCKDNNSNKDI